MTKADLIAKVRDHLAKAKARALMMSNAQSPTDRGRYLKQMAEELTKANQLLDKVELLE